MRYSDIRILIAEALLRGSGARRSILIRKAKDRKATENEIGFIRRVYGADAPVPEIPVDPTKKLRPRKTDRRGLEIGTARKDFRPAERAAEANKENAHDIVGIFARKPHGTKITIHGKKYGKDAPHAMHVSRKRTMGMDVHVLHGTDRQVELRPTGAGLQVIDRRTNRILLDKGHDAEW